MHELSVVLPCWNARRTLRRALDALALQDVPTGTFEIVIVDDGSTDGSVDSVRGWEAPVPLRIVSQSNRGLAAARNTGVAAARASTVLFLDPDVFADPGLVRAHLQRHRPYEGNVAVQGRTIPDPASITTPFMRTTTLLPDLTVRRQENLSPFHVVGRNFSVGKSALEGIGGFDETFTGYGFEDIEFAFRFRQAGGRILYEPEALGLHSHPMTIEQAVARQRENGRAAIRFYLKHGRRMSLGLQLEVHPLLLPLKRLVFGTRPLTLLVETLRPWAERRGRYLILSECYNHLLWRAYYEGVARALREMRDAAPAVAPPPP